MQRRLFRLATPLLAAPWAFLACGQDEIRDYNVPKEAPSANAAPVQAPDAGPGGAPMVAPANGTESVVWTLPDGWQEKPGEGMRFATLLLPVGANEPPLEMRVTPLALAARDPLANVNRWRDQIGLPPIAPEALAQVARPVDVGGRTAHLVDMTGVAHAAEPARQILAAILEGDERVWFFLVMDTPERAGKQAQAFADFIGTVRVRPAAVAAGGLPPGHPAVATGELPSDHPPTGGGAGNESAGQASMQAPAPGSAPAADSPVQWTTPAGWTVSVAPNPSRLATFSIVEGSNKAEVTITRFPGDVGGLLPNINRWRGQIGLKPVADASQQPMEALEVDGAPSQLLDLQGAGETSSRMLVVLTTRGGFTYFVKMTGPGALLGRERQNFVTFARSLRFAPGTS